MHLVNPNGHTLHMDTRRRRAAALAVAWCAACVAAGTFAYATLEFNPDAGQFAPPWVSFVFFAALAVTIIAANVSGRLRATDAMVKAFEAGFKSAERYFKEMIKEMREK